METVYLKGNTPDGGPLRIPTVESPSGASLRHKGIDLKAEWTAYDRLLVGIESGWTQQNQNIIKERRQWTNRADSNLILSYQASRKEANRMKIGNLT